MANEVLDQEKPPETASEVLITRRTDFLHDLESFANTLNSEVFSSREKDAVVRKLCQTFANLGFELDLASYDLNPELQKTYSKVIRTCYEGRDLPFDYRHYQIYDHEGFIKKSMELADMIVLDYEQMHATLKIA